MLLCQASTIPEAVEVRTLKEQVMCQMSHTWEIMARSAGNVNRILRTVALGTDHIVSGYGRRNFLAKQNLNMGKFAHGCMIKCLGTTCVKGGY